jgi:2OG-Fe(II) oxygenase superfamily
MLDGGGLHMVGTGGRLNVHVDFSHHPRTKLNRRLNLLLYLNRDWKLEYHGELEFWDKDLTKALSRISPVFNRCVIFSTTRHSFHGHPVPLDLPPDTYRRSIALYYFSPGRTDQEDVHHNTLFRSRPGDPFNLSNTVIRTLSSGPFRSAIPPALYELFKRLYLRRYGTGD